MDLKGLKVIYEPRGKAKEYADLALNIYNGCTHECVYCYAKRFKPDYFEHPNPKKDIVNKVERDLKLLQGQKDIPYVTLSFQGDVYLPEEKELQITRQVLELFRKYKVPFAILTKGSELLYRDFDIFEECKNFCKVGVTIGTNIQDVASKWEKNTPSIESRKQVLKDLKKHGIKTWISIEPILDMSVLELIDEVKEYVDEIKIGKLNYQKADNIDWISFSKLIKEKLEKTGVSFVIKESITQYFALSEISSFIKDNMTEHRIWEHKMVKNDIPTLVVNCECGEPVSHCYNIESKETAIVCKNERCSFYGRKFLVDIIVKGELREQTEM